MAQTRDYVNIISKKGDDASTKIRVTVVETVEKSRSKAGTPVESKMKRTGCRELVESNASLPRATPSIHLHICGCTCSSESSKDLAQQQREDEALARRIQAASAVCRAKSISGSPPGSPRNVSIAAFQSVSRWFSGGSSDTTAIVAELCFACDALDITKAARLLFDEGVPVNGRNAAGTPPLIAAVRSHIRATRPRSHLAMISFLIDAGADPNIVTGSSPASGTMSVLAAASSLGLREAVWLLLDHGAAVDAKLTTIPMFRFTGHNLTALHVAVFAGQTSTAEVLLSHGGADVSATFDGHRAIGATDAKSPKQRDRRTWTTDIAPLHLADDSAACTELLLRHNAEPDAPDGWGRTPLHWAMTTGNPDVVKLLLRVGTPVDGLDDDGATPLAVLVARLESGASRQGHPVIVRMLLAAGANPDLRYPQDLSVKARLLLMEEWRAVYEPIFERYQIGSPRLGQGRWS